TGAIRYWHAENTAAGRTATVTDLMHDIDSKTGNDPTEPDGQISSAASAYTPGSADYDKPVAREFRRIENHVQLARMGRASKPDADTPEGRQLTLLQELE